VVCAGAILKNGRADEPIEHCGADLERGAQHRSLLRSAQGVADQILVVDSGSQDATVSLAQGLGAEVVAYPDWQGFGEQRSRALQHVQADWVFFLDADERLTPALADEIRQVVADNAEAVWEVEWEQMAYGQSLGRMRGTGGVARLFPMRVLEGFSGAVHEGAVLRSTHPASAPAPAAFLA
jgi:glycosyltransferase involved in cell wall biosynthesis